MNEIQIIQQQLATEQLHFTEVADLSAATLSAGHFVPGSAFARACAEYFSFAVTRLAAIPTLPAARATPSADAPPEQWREFLGQFRDAVRKHFSAIDQLRSQTLAVTEWRARSGIDADSIYTERTRYKQVKATVP